jgi:protein ImuB
LPLNVLSSNSDFLETLQRWGIRTFGSFAKLPRTKVAERLGQEGAQLHKLSRGELSRPLNPYKESLRFEETMELDHAILLLEPLTFVLSRLLDQICRRLRVRNRSTHEIRVTLDLDERGAPAHERVLRLPLPICDPRLLVKLLMLDLESNPPRAGVVRARVEAIPTRPRTVQNGLFVPLAPEPEKLELTLARIAHVVGQENVGYPVLLDTHRPDAFRIERFCALTERAYSVGAVYDRPTIAFRQFRPALEATVQIRAGVPAWIAFRGLFGPITTVSGPWNSSGDWWREDRWAREEWDVGIEARSNSLAMYRIYRDCAGNRWFVDGVYD